MRCRLLAVVFSLLMLLPLLAWANTPAAKSTGGSDNKDGAGLRLREGEVIEATGKLELSGDRAIFYPKGEKASLRVLENLALERVTRVLSESRDEREWIVSGTVTEYRGANYILIHKAVQRARKESIAK